MSVSLDKKGPGLYTLTVDISSNPKVVTIKNYDGVEFDTPYLQTIPPGNSTANIDISEQGDGVFLLTIKETGEVDIKIIIYEFSSMIECQKQVISKVFVLSDETCTEDNKEIRDCLNQLIAYTGLILARTNVETMRYLDIFTIDETRQDYINVTGLMMDKINLLIKNCVQCGA